MSEYLPVRGTTEHTSSRRRQFGCVIVLLGMLLVGLLVAGYLCVFRSVPLRISKETTYITGPLKSDGKRVDYLAAWEQATYPKNIATEENGYRLIVEHIGKSPEATTEYFSQLCEKLGLSADTLEPDMPYAELHDTLNAYVESADYDKALIERLAGMETPQVEKVPDEISAMELLDARLRQPWTLDDLPMMETWLAENGPALDLVGQAVRKPVFHIPLVSQSEDERLINQTLPDIQHARRFARGLSARANYRVATGDIDGAIDDLVACKRFGRHFSPGGCLVQMLVGTAMEGIADSIGIAGSLEHPPTKEQLERLSRELKDLPPKAKFEEVMPFERFTMLDEVQAMAHGDEQEFLVHIPFGIGTDWNVVATQLNRHFDTMLATGEDPARPSLDPMAIISVRARSRMFADTIGALMLPASGAAHEAMRRSVCVDRLHHITLAMLLYERDHGTLPPAHTTGAGGVPLHSWRVALLPYVGQQELYEKIRLDEPWDSAHNRQFHKQAVDFYQCPSASLSPGQTTYSVVVGPDAPFEAGKGKPLSQFGPKSARMILVVERRQAACWMDPNFELPQAAAEQGINRPDGGGMSIGSQHPGGANFGLRDGSVNFLSETIDAEQFKALLHGTGDKVP